VPETRALRPRLQNLLAVAAAALAFASAAVTAFWLLGEEQARERSAAALAVLAVTLLAKLAAGWLALALAHSRTEGKRSVITLGLVGGVGLALYGGVLVIAGALALAGVGESSGRDDYALRWHVFFWDPWFLIWGVALALAAVRARRLGRTSVDA
jgi:membrane protease YdiL (CAAX protease family)